jgi:hypothetical protein
MTDSDPLRVPSRGAISGPVYVEWGAVLAGSFLAAALSFVLLTFGGAIGLSAVSPWPGSGASTTVIASLAVLWVFVQQIGSFMAGGYVAGRMRTRWIEADQDEVNFRDGLHGGLVWAVGVVVAAGLLMATASATARTGAAIAGASIAATADPMDMVLDTLLRPAAVAQATEPTAETTSAASAAIAASEPQATARAEMARILARTVTDGILSDQDRPYFSSVVATRTGISRQEAEKRVDAAFVSARQAADTARSGAALVGFVTAAALIVSLGAAWWAAMRGGHHRDNAVPARFATGQYRRSKPSV